jgi:hypothetical protein
MQVAFQKSFGDYQFLPNKLYASFKRLALFDVGRRKVDPALWDAIKKNI